MKIGFKLILVFMVLNITACKMTKKYEWTTTDCAPRHFRSRIIFASLHYGKNNGAAVPDGKNIGRGWGRSGTAYSDATLKEVPSKLDIIWLSFRENKFYGGSFDLPKAKMEQLFEEGFLNSGTTLNSEMKRTYEEIVVGVAPGGYVGVWLNGHNNSVQVAGFYGEETEYDFSRVLPNGTDDRESYVVTVLKHTPTEELEKPIPFGLWETYAKTYSWKPVIQGDVIKGIDLLNTKFYNGDQEFIWKSDTQKIIIKNRRIPNYCSISWDTGKGYGFKSNFYFDEQEIFAAFKEMLTNPETQKATLIFRFTGEKEAHVFLKVGDQERPLNKGRLETYNNTFIK